MLHRSTKEIRAWTGLNNGSGAELNCGQMRLDTLQNPSVLQQCYREMDYTNTSQVRWVEDANGNRSEYLYDAHDRRKSRARQCIR